MAKWSDVIGYSIETEKSPGVWVPEIVEKRHYGDVLRNVFNNASSDGANSNLTINNQVSVVINPFILKHCHSIVYVKYLETYWEVKSFDVQRPRIILTLGGVYNGETFRSP